MPIKRRRALLVLGVAVAVPLSQGSWAPRSTAGFVSLPLGASTGRCCPVLSPHSSHLTLGPAKKSGAADDEPKKPRSRKASGSTSKKSSPEEKEESSGSPGKSAARAGTSSSAPPKPRTPKKPKETPSAFYDTTLVEEDRALEMYSGDETFNFIKMGEDVVAPWSVGGFEIDLPDWRPQPVAKYEIVDETIHDRIGKIYKMFGCQIRLVSTHSGIYRFLYWGEIRNLIGAEAWTQLILTEDLGIKDVKKVRFETSYVRDYPDDYN